VGAKERIGIAPGKGGVGGGVKGSSRRKWGKNRRETKNNGGRTCNRVQEKKKTEGEG